jgi:hypothetical protein
MSCLLFDRAIEPLPAMLRDSNLKGYEIPGSKEKLIANLFADDTTTFLSEKDDIRDMEQILDKWCTASTAKFNIQKTEIIPIGTEMYRRKVIDQRKTCEDGTEIPENWHIAKDGEAIRILGAWVGNKINAESIWVPLIEKIDSALDRWERVNPTIEGRKIIIQMVIGGMTQYLANVQRMRMPKSVENRLIKRQRKFIWGERTMSPVSMGTLHAQKSIGGP